MRLKPQRGTGRKERTYQRGSTDFSELPNDVIQASLSLALPGSSIPDRLRSGRRGERQGDWLGVSIFGPDRREGAVGMEKQGCGVDGLERCEEGDLGTDCLVIHEGTKIFTNSSLHGGAFALCQALCAIGFVCLFSQEAHRNSQVGAAMGERKESKITSRILTSRDW